MPDDGLKEVKKWAAEKGHIDTKGAHDFFKQRVTIGWMQAHGDWPAGGDELVTELEYDMACAEALNAT